MSTRACTGADELTEACTRCGSFRRAKLASMPGYEPPHVTILFASVRPYAAVTTSMKRATSPMAWRDERKRSAPAALTSGTGHADALKQP